MSKKIDLTGQRFGRLTVVKEAGIDREGRITWDCLCDCGKQKAVAGKHLRNGSVVSCGCLKRERMAKIHRTDEVGKIYGKVEVLSDAGSISNEGGRIWNCRCLHCDKPMRLTTARLRCKPNGCFSCSRKKPVTIARVQHRRMQEIKERIKEIGGSIPDTTINTLMTSPCFYCGKLDYPETKQVQALLDKTHGFSTTAETADMSLEAKLQGLRLNGIDRIDSSKGYIEGNCVSCCGTCNRMKLTHSTEDWLAHMKQVISHMEKKGDS